MSKTFDGLSENQDRVLANIALGGSARREHPRTVAVLLERGLIVQIGEEEVSSDLFGVVLAPVYEMPIPQHMRWCQWCTDNVPLPEDEK